MNAARKTSAPAELPPSLAELHDAIGLEALLALVEHFGGSRIYVPLESRLHEAHGLVKALGEPAARALCRARQAEFDVPRAVEYVRALRDAEIRRAYATESADQLARRFKVSRRRILDIVGADRAGATQGDLF